MFCQPRTRISCNRRCSCYRCRTASKSSAAAAAETFSESILPRCGSATSPSQAEATRGRIPFPSPPRTRIVGPAQDRRSRAPARRPRRRPRSRSPPASPPPSQSARLRDPGDRQVLDRPRRRLAGSGRDLSRATIGNDDTGRPRHLGRASRPRQGCAGPEPGPAQRSKRSPLSNNWFRSAYGYGIDLGHNTLMIRRPTKPLQLLGTMSREPARPAEPAASPAQPRPPAACRRSPGKPSRLRHELRALSRVPNLPPQLSQPIPNLVSPPEVLRRPRHLPFLEEFLRLVVGLSSLIRLSKGAEADERRASPPELGAASGAATSPRFASPTSSNTSAIALGVLKSSASASRKLSTREPAAP